jgi:hypothetical protein
VCVRVPAQPAPTTHTTTDPCSSGSTVVFHVRKGWGRPGRDGALSISLVLCCARLLAYCSITPLAAPWAHQPAYSLRLSRACLARFLACCSVSPLVASCLPPLRLLAIRYRPFSFCLVLSSPFASAPAAVLDLPALQSSSVQGSSFASIDSYR